MLPSSVRPYLADPMLAFTAAILVCSWWQYTLIGVLAVPWMLVILVVAGKLAEMVPPTVIRLWGNDAIAHGRKWFRLVGALRWPMTIFIVWIIANVNHGNFRSAVSPAMMLLLMIIVFRKLVR